ncbi:hypothetical protein KY285_024270 [Solanum tuberosum]|nr:hypothetical protein KY285_024270 [Solanum tuberosum]
MNFLSIVVEKCSNFMIKSLDKESDKLEIIRNEMWLLHYDVELRLKEAVSIVASPNLKYH